MRRIASIGFTAIIIMQLSLALCLADVALQSKGELKTQKDFQDLAFSRNGQWLYLLYRTGDLEVYSNQGKQQGKVTVGKGFDMIEASPIDDEIYLVSRKDRRIQIVEVMPVLDIDIKGSPFKGAADAPVVIAEFTDFQCPYCAQIIEIYDQLLKLYPGKIKIVYKCFPLRSHRYSLIAAVNAMAAHKMGKFWEFHDRVFENFRQLNDQKIMEIRKELGLDTPEVDSLIRSPEVRAKVIKDREQGLNIGVKGTPTVFVNGKRLKDKTLEGFKEAIDNELKLSQKKKA